MVSRRNLIIVGVAVGLMVFGFLGLRFGGQIIEPWLSSTAARTDSVAVDTSAAQSGVPADSATVTDTTGMIIRHGPFVIDGMPYRIEVLRDTGAQKDPRAARRVEVFDSTGQRVYEENLFLRFDSTSASDGIVFHPSLLEDESGIARGLDFSYAWFPSSPSSGVAFHVVAPRGRSLAVLTSGLVGYYGSVASLPPGSAPRSGRLLPGNRLTIESNRGWFDASIPLRIDFGCVPQSGNCVRFDLKDSIGGLARFTVNAKSRARVDTAVAIELFAQPNAAVGTAVTVPAGQEVEILGGAGRVFFERVNGLYVSGDGEWLQVRVNGRTGWITGAPAFTAIGLLQGG